MVVRRMVFEVVSEIVGRERELTALHDFADEVKGRPAALVLEGEAGIGKSTLWLAGVAHARARGLRVLYSRPAEAERGLAHVGRHHIMRRTLQDRPVGLRPSAERRAPAIGGRATLPEPARARTARTP
jgi:hypothetical protein